MSDKPLPPYGLVVEAYQKEGIGLEFPLYLFIGKNSYSEAKSNKELGCLTLCLPSGKSIDDYRWPVVGQRIVINDTGGMSLLGIRKMASQLLKMGAVSVCIVSDLCPIEVYPTHKSQG